MTSELVLRFFDCGLEFVVFSLLLRYFSLSTFHPKALLAIFRTEDA